MLEVMLVTALLAIILSLATPSYLSAKQRSHRTVAISKLMQVAGCQERVRANAGQYDTRLCLPNETPNYSFRFEPENTDATLDYKIIADPGSAQSSDSCGAMILNQDGLRNVGNNKADTNRCWAGR